MNRVLRFAETDGQKKNNVGFALQILQRRLASSPAAIYQSLKRRRERLENELVEARLIERGKKVGFSFSSEMLSDEVLRNIDEYGEDDIEEFEYGKFVHIMDPEGNKIELWEPIDSFFTQMGGTTTK